ncbi:MAG: GIY-YIG nuclease family protein [Bacteroidia bacterium]
MYWVYILYSEKGQRYYIGQTQDVAERLERHNCGYEKSTSPYRPYKLVCKIEKPTRGEAMQLEKKLKNLNTEDLQKFIQKWMLRQALNIE